MSSERATIMRHAGTVMVGQLAVMAFSITDTLVAGHFADTALAALAVASATYVTVHISLMGMLQALLPAAPCRPALMKHLSAHHGPGTRTVMAS